MDRLFLMLVALLAWSGLNPVLPGRVAHAQDEPIESTSARTSLTRRDRFEEAYRRFARDLAQPFPTLRSRPGLPPFDPSSKELTWTGTFARWLAKNAAEAKAMIQWSAAHRPEHLGFMMPADLEGWLNRELFTNDNLVDLSVFLDVKVPAKFDPRTQRIEAIGYVDIPVDEAWTRQGSNLDRETDGFLLIRRDGRIFARTFIDPLMELKEAAAIARYGGLKKDGSYAFRRTASPRSLVIWRTDRPWERMSVKVSLDELIGDIRRLNEFSKLHRSHAMNQAIATIPPADKKKFRFDVLPEVIQAQIPGRRYGWIVRRLLPRYFADGRADRLVPGQSVVSEGANGKPPILIEWIRRSGLPTERFLREILYPLLIEPYLYLSLEQGWLAEPHQQNTILVEGADGLPESTIYRDLDAFRTDPVLRALRDLSLAPYLDVPLPMGKLKLAEGASFYEKSFNTYLRNAWIYAIEKVLERYADELKLPKDYLASRRAWLDFDRVFIEVAVRHLGTEVVLGDLRQKDLPGLFEAFPGVDWARPVLDTSTLKRFLDRYPLHGIFDGWFGRITGEPAFSFQHIANRARARLLRKLTWDAEAQAGLRTDFERLKAAGRAIVVDATALPQARFVRKDGAILATLPDGQLTGVALTDRTAFHPIGFSMLRCVAEHLN